MITDINQLDFSKKYTYADYLTWQFDEMVELISGKIFRMSPAPSLYHQSISRNLLILIGNYLDQKRCKVFHAPFDVRLPLPPQKQNENKFDTVVQPDISVVCDLGKLDVRGCNGPPDWIIEILSKSTAQKDLNEKFYLYQHAGVKEYWLVLPHEETILVYILDSSGKYTLVRQKPFVRNEKITVNIFEEFEIELEKVFKE